MKNLEEVIKKHTNDDGAVDFKAIEELINKETNDVIAAKTDEDKVVAKAVEKVISDLGIDGRNIDDVKLYIKKMGGNTDEFKEANVKLEKELETLRVEKEEALKQKATVETEFRTNKQYGSIRNELGLTDDEQVEFLHHKLSKQVTEEKDFDSVLKEYHQTNADKYRKNETSFKKVRPGSSESKEGSILAAWEEKYGNKK